MTTPSNFEKLLSNQESRSYIERLTNLPRLLIELGSNDQKLFSLLGSDMKHFNDTRKTIRDSLSPDSSRWNSCATHWISFMKPRVELLEYQANYFSSLAAYSAGGCAFLALFLAPLSGWTSAFLAGGDGLVAMVCAGFRVSIDRRRAYYKYLIAHLDAIKAGSVGGQRPTGTSA